jgi:hypothetical protein
MLKSGPKLHNPLREENLDIQDIKGDSYALRKPLSTILRVEAVGYVAVACALYAHLGFSWPQFFLWFLLPDIAILVYVFAGNRAGMWAYNITHSGIGPALLSVYAIVARDALCQQAALIWWAHIGFDRALGYGLKARHGFRVTHLGVLKGMAAKP